MPRSSTGSERLSTATSRLGRALLKLHAALDRVEEREEKIESLLSAWDRSWEQRRSEILRWLSSAEDGVVAEEASEPPVFSLVRMPIDADEMSSMPGPDGE